MKTLTLEQADALVSTDDRYGWETYAKTLTFFRPSRRSVLMRKDGYYNRAWRFGKGQWGTLKRVEIGNDGLFRL